MAAIDWNAVSAAANGASAPQSALQSASAPQGAIDWSAVANAANSPPASTAPSVVAPGNLDQLGYMAQAFGHHLISPLHGAAQFVENGVAAAANKLPDNPVSRAIVSTASADNQATNQWEQQYQASVPNGWGADVGATAGTVAPFVISAIPNSLKALGTAVASRVLPTAEGASPSLLARALSGSSQGAAVGAAQPVTSASPAMSYDDYLKAYDAAPDQATKIQLGKQYDASVQAQQSSYWDQKGKDIGTGAAFGGAMPLLAGAANGAWQAGKGAVTNSALLNPSGYASRNIATQLGPETSNVASNLRSAPQFVSGSMPTSAQAGASPDLVMMEKALANQNPDFAKTLLNRQNSNNAARLQVVSGVAQTPEALQAAIDGRNAVTTPMRQFSVDNGNSVPVGGVTSPLSSVINGPQGVQPTIGPAANTMLNKVNGFTTTTPPNHLMNTPGSSTATPAYLDQLRQSVNDYLSANAPTGVSGTSEQAAMMPIKSAIVNAIDGANPGHKLSQGGWGQGLEQSGPTAPGYKDYLSEFSKRSVPVNTMELGQDLQSKLLSGGLNSAGDAQASLPGYRSALAAALRRSDYGIDPQAQAALEGVQSDLQRATISNSVRMGGSDTAYNQGTGSSFLKALGTGGGDETGKMVTAGAAVGAMTGSPQAAAGAAFAAKKAGGFVTNRVGSSLGDLLMNPQKLADALTAAGKPQSTTVPSLLNGFSGRLTPAMMAALALELQKQQTPAVVDRTKQSAY